MQQKNYDVHNNRLERLMNLYVKYCENEKTNHGSQKKFSELITVNEKLLSNIFNGQKQIGSGIARRIEAVLGLQKGILDLPMYAIICDNEFEYEELTRAQPEAKIKAEERMQKRIEDMLTTNLERVNLFLLKDAVQSMDKLNKLTTHISGKPLNNQKGE